MYPITVREEIYGLIDTPPGEDVRGLIQRMHRIAPEKIEKMGISFAISPQKKVFQELEQARGKAAMHTLVPKKK